LTTALSTRLTKTLPFVKVGPLSDLAPDSLREAMVDGCPYAICHVGGEVRAPGGVCPHRGGPLGQGQRCARIHEGRVVCPYHLWEFDCRTGAYDYDPARRVETLEVRVEDGEILLRVP
jgi:nitrite reductase (NADH) small subunit